MMKLKNLLTPVLALLATSLTLGAQTGVETGTPFGSGDDSIQCRQNISLFTSYVKGNNFKEAYPFWLEALEKCPASTKNIYLYGVQIMNWKIETAEDDAARQDAIEKLLKLYDMRIQYFGDDPKYGKDYITTAKINDYLRLYGDKASYDKIYDWAKPIVDEMGEETESQLVYFFVFASMNKAIGNPDWHERYVDDYMTGNGILQNDVDALTEAGDTVKLQNIQALKGQLDELFATSGLADCDMLIKIYGDGLEKNKDNIKYLQAMLDMFRYAKCENSPLYATASRYLYNIKPTAAAAMGIASECIDKGQMSQAKQYLNDAISLTSDKRLQATAYYTLGVIDMKARSYASARQYCNKAMAANPSFGAPLILIAQMYAASAKSIFPDDPVKQRLVYGLAIDKLQKARSIDSSVSGEAGRLISQYSGYLPSQQDIFFHPDLNSGDSFYVGGWIGESTRIR